MSKPYEISEGSGVPVADEAQETSKQVKKEDKQKKSFDPAKVKTAYTEEQWKQKVQWYQDKVQSCASFTLVNDIASFQNLLVQCDGIISIFCRDYENTMRKLDNYKELLDREEKKIYNQVKQALKETNEKQKDPTINEIECEMFKLISNHKVGKSDKNLYEIIDIYEDRAADMRAVKTELSHKMAIIPNYTSVIKMQYEIDGKLPRVHDVPNNL